MCTHKKSSSPVLLLTILLLLFATMAHAQAPNPIWALGTYDCSKGLKVSFASHDLGDQNDSWDDTTYPSVRFEVNGSEVFSVQYYEAAGANGRISSFTKETGISFTKTDDTWEAFYISEEILKVGSNSIRLIGTWEERVPEGSNKYTNCDGTVEYNFDKPEPPTGGTAKIDDNGKVTLSWTNPSALANVVIVRGTTTKATLGSTATSWTDPTANLDAETYKIYAVDDVDGCDVRSSPLTVSPPDPPKVSKPAGLSATTDRCDGKVLLTWDYTGEVEPTRFEIVATPGGTFTPSGDEREYLHDIGLHSSATYKIRAIGPINNSDYTTNLVTGSTSGVPTKPTSFTAYRTTATANTITLTWSDSNHETKYVVIRNSSTGTAEIEINEDETSYVDAAVNGCETYSYELYSANICTEDGGLTGIKADASPSVRLDPDITAYITDFDASKAYFPDIVLLEWTVEDNNLTLVDNFIIERRVAGETSYTAIGSAEGTNSYQDKVTSGNVLYEYRITAKLKCENTDKTSNSKTAVGFRTPFGIVSGNVKYENGVSVKGVEVLAEKSTAAIGNSLSYNGSNYVNVPNDEKLNPPDYMAAEAWIRPNTVTGTASIIDKESGNIGYRIYQSNRSIVFGMSIGGNWETVTVPDVLTANDYIHVAGVKDSTGLKLYINGEVPFNTNYSITTADIAYLSEIGIDTEIIDALGIMVDAGDTYTDFANFKTDLNNLIGSAQAQLLLPFLTPIVTNHILISGTYEDVTGIINHTSTNLRIGEGFKGQIDEVRIWNRARDAERVDYDFKRVLGNDEAGLAAYWRCDENFGENIYDASKSNGEYHRNDGVLINGVSWSAEIPNQSQLGWMGKTDEKGYYNIPYIPYLGSGENFILTPRFGQHQFEPAQRTLFLGEGANIAEEKNFTDISSFKVVGNVKYEGTTCGVEGAIVGVDGQPVIKNGQPVFTDANGEFEIAVPVGEHYVYVEKSGHIFESFKFPLGPESIKFDFQEEITGINFIDKTIVTVTGRVVGGTREGNKDPGLGLSKNNIGIAQFEFQSAVDCSSYPVVTDSLTGEYSVDVPPMVYLIKDFDVPKNPAVYQYFSEFPEADFSQINERKLVTNAHSGVVDMMVTVNRGNQPVTATLKIDGVPNLVNIDSVAITAVGSKEAASFIYSGQAYEYIIDTTSTIVNVYDEVAGNNTIDSAYYNYRYDLIYRTPPQLRVTDTDGVSKFIGEKIVKYEDPASGILKKINVEENPFNYPIFAQGQAYSLLIHAEEYYYNQDMCSGLNGCDDAVLDRVPVNDGKLVINNLLARDRNPDPINFTNGTTSYTFNAGEPTLLTDANFSYRDYSGIFNISLEVENVGAFEWEPFENKDSLNFDYPGESLHPDDKYYRGYVFGTNPIEGSDFVTDGPQMVDMILRDPPGNGSYSYLEKGTTFSYEESISFGEGSSTSFNEHISLGPEFETGVPGNTVDVVTVADADIGFSKTSSKNEEGGISHEVTTTNTWQTASDPYMPGAQNDLFFGSSVNYVVSLADNLSIFPVGYADSTGIPTSGSEVTVNGRNLKIGLNKSLMMAADGAPTHFIYTANHIESFLIKNLKKVRNNLFISNPNYKSNIPIDHPLYGSNNDNPDWGDLATSENFYSAVIADMDGPSYTFTPESDDEEDMVRKLNQQIRLWINALERNEMEKYYAETVQNISYDAGPVYENSVSTSVTRSHSTSFELSVTQNFAASLGAYFGGVGLELQLSFDFERSTGKTTTSATTETNTFGYVFYDEDEGDYFTVDVKDPGTGTGPVFAMKAGRTMCPCERATEMSYFEPAKYTITDSIIGVLQNLNADAEFIKVISRGASTGNYTLEEIENDFVIPSIITKVLPADAEFNVPQIKNREFRKRYELLDACMNIINMGLDVSNEAVALDINFSLASLSDGEVREYNKYVEGDIAYLFSKEKRDALTEALLNYQDYIYELSGTPIKNPGSLDVSTLRREWPVASISPSIVQNVPDDNKAYFTMQMGNMSETDEAQIYEAKVVESSNPDGAIIWIDGSPVQRGYVVGAGEYINKTITVEMGRPDVYEYNDLQIIFYSACERELVGKITGDIPPEAIDTVTFSVHFVPSCTDVEIIRPKNQFIINTEDEHLVDGVKETKVPILMTGYDLNNNLFDKLNFQFKSAADPDWIMTEDFYVVAEVDELEIPGNYTAVEWDVSGYPDGEYNLRAKTYCGYLPDGSEMYDLSEVWSGVIDRKAPQVFGTPQPADGILSPDDDIIIEFNEEIFDGKLNKFNNFDIRGILNGTDLRHDVSIGFRDNTEDFVRIPYGINLVNKSFTIEFWMQTLRSNVRECLFSQNTDPDNSILIELTENGTIEFHIGDKTYLEDGLSTADIVGDWHHWAFIYDRVRSEVIVMVDGVPLGTSSLAPSYSGYGDVYLGKSMIANNNPFSGNLHELRIWERPRTASALAANMLINLSGKETGLIGYWPFTEAYGKLAADKVHKRNATVSTSWHITPTGYAATFNGTSGLLNTDFSDIAFTPEQDFSIEFWFKSSQGSNTCLVSNGYGDENDIVLYYYSIEDLAETANVLPLEDGIEDILEPMLNTIYPDETEFLNEIASYIGSTKTANYKEQLLRFGKHMPTYWSLNTNVSGNIQINNNGKRLVLETEENYFDNQWHHFALVVQRKGNTRVYLDGELMASEPSTEWNGFGAARLFVGARGLFNPNIGGFQFDQYFNGKMDELRIWNTALKQTQIARNGNIRMDGDELGLVSYFPFESYVETMGIPKVTGQKTDIITNDREVLSNLGVTLQASDVANIQMTRPSSKVDFDFVAQTNRVAFILNEPNEKVENCVLDITAKNVEDMHGNKMSSPVTWSAFVDRNQMKWADEQFDLEKEIYAPLSFTTEIINSSGQQQAYSIENLPEWCSVSPREGTLEPLSSQLVTFVINEGVNVGTFSKDISLKTDFGFDEKLQVNLRVYQPLPSDWVINPQDFEHSMNIIGVIAINGVISADPYDKVAAFVNGQCRGIANLKYIEEYDLYEVYLDIYSNEVYGEYFELHIWDASSGREFRGITGDGLVVAPEEYPDHYKFVDNTVYGSPSNPIKLNANSTIIQKISLSKGWNWLSFNLALDRSKTLSQLIDGYSATNEDIIKGLTTYSEYAEYWIGTLNFLEPEEMYMFKVGAKDTLKVTGQPIMVEKTPIPILRGWNWIGYTPSVNIGINDAFGQFEANIGDVVKSQFAFSMYDQYLGWVGTLEFLRPNQGYKYQYQRNSGTPDVQTLYYPNAGTVLKSGSGKKDEGPKPGIADWSKFQFNMSLVAELEGLTNQTTKDQIFVYCNDSLRGTATPINISEGKFLYFITIYGNEMLEELNFSYVNSYGNKYELNEKLLFEDKVEGSINSPFIFNLSGIVTHSNTFEGGVNFLELNVFPNPFSDNVIFDISQSTVKTINIEILDVLGRKVFDVPEFKAQTISKSINLSALRSGIYMAKVEVGNTVLYRKIIKE